MKKYELTSETKMVCGITLHRIRALIDIKRWSVKSGDMGGWIESEANLDQSGEAWVSGKARVSGEARVSGKARVFGEAWVSDEARVFGEAWVSGKARVFGEAWVSDEARVSGKARVFDEARVSDEAWVSDKAWVFGEARVSGEARVFGEARVSKCTHMLTVGRIGSRNDITTFFQTRSASGFAISVSCGCFCGTVAEFRREVVKTHGDNKHGRVYQLAADLAEAQVELDVEAQ